MRPRTRSDPFHAILADNSTIRRDDHPRFPAPTRPTPVHPVFNIEQTRVLSSMWFQLQHVAWPTDSRNIRNSYAVLDPPNAVIVGQLI